MIVHKDIPYRQSESVSSPLNTLDIYHTPWHQSMGKKRVVVFIHGGNWRGGSKDLEGTELPDWFVQQQFILVAVNFRLADNHQSSTSSIEDSADDIAKATKWLTVNISRYGGFSDGFIFCGYSSGGHLATLLAADPRYLARYRLSASLIRCVVVIDTPHLDVPTAIEFLETEGSDVPQGHLRLVQIFRLMGNSRDKQVRFSPAHYLGRHLASTAFLLLTAGNEPGSLASFSKRMAEDFLSRLRALGIEASHIHFPTHTHADILGCFTGNQTGVIADHLHKLNFGIE